MVLLHFLSIGQWDLFCHGLNHQEVEFDDGAILKVVVR
jgi:hypothetical protein